VFQVELASYFALTVEQIQEMTNNWSTQYTSEKAGLLASIVPLSISNQNTESAGYWQWANAYLTVA
jgi:hypothetical protein